MIAVSIDCCVLHPPALPTLPVRRLLYPSPSRPLPTLPVCHGPKRTPWKRRQAAKGWVLTSHPDCLADLPVWVRGSILARIQGEGAALRCCRACQGCETGASSPLREAGKRVTVRPLCFFVCTCNGLQAPVYNIICSYDCRNWLHHRSLCLWSDLLMAYSRVLKKDK